MTDKMIIEKKASKNEICESGKTKTIEKTEFKNGGSFKGNTLKRKIVSVDKTISKRSKFKRNLNLTTTILTNLNLRNEKLAPILNSCIKETLLRTDVNLLETLNAYYTKG